MSDADRQKWQARYLEGAYADRLHPSRYLEEQLSTLDLPASYALDLACGAGRNALFLARQGFQVDAVDIAPEALRRGKAVAEREGARIRWIEHDFDKPLPDSLRDYGLIIMIRYLNLPLMQAAADRLVGGGCLLAEVHLQTRHEVAGPSGTRFRAAAGDLEAAANAAGLIIEDYSEGLHVDPDGRQVALARLVGRAVEPVGDTP